MPMDVDSWRRNPEPMFAGVTNKAGQPFLRATQLAECNESDKLEHWRLEGGWDRPSLIPVGDGNNSCLSLIDSGDSSHPVGLIPCAAASRWVYTTTSQLRVAGTNECLDVDHGQVANIF